MALAKVPELTGTTSGAVVKKTRSPSRHTGIIRGEAPGCCQESQIAKSLLTGLFASAMHILAQGLLCPNRLRQLRLWSTPSRQPARWLNAAKTAPQFAGSDPHNQLRYVVLGCVTKHCHTWWHFLKEDKNFW